MFPVQHLLSWGMLGVCIDHRNTHPEWAINPKLLMCELSRLSEGTTWQIILWIMILWCGLYAFGSIRYWWQVATFILKVATCVILLLPFKWASIYLPINMITPFLVRVILKVRTNLYSSALVWKAVIFIPSLHMLPLCCMIYPLHLRHYITPYE